MADLDLRPDPTDPFHLTLGAPTAAEVRLIAADGREAALLTRGGSATHVFTLTALDADGRASERRVTLTVTGATQPQPPAPPPIGTRPPTVTLTPDNIRRLQRYPRPPRDNGIGLHFHLDLRPDFITDTVGHLKEIRATWTLIYAPDELQAEAAARASFAAGILPVVRIARRVDEPVNPAPFVDALRRAWRGAGWPLRPGELEPLYVQLYNEPEDLREWTGGVLPRDWARRFGEAWAANAPKIADAGGLVGIQTLDRFGFDEAVDAVKRVGRADIWDKAFFVHHNYGQNHPPAYPYDEVKQRLAPGVTILDDHVAALKFLAHAHWMRERLGFVLPIIGGEGGWWMYNDEDKHYPKVEWPLHAAYHREMYEWFRTGLLSNGEPLPDYLFSITSWIAGSWTFAAQNWWGNSLSPTGKLDQTIDAMQRIPPFVRRFSWEDAVPPEPDPHDEPGPEPEPDPDPGPRPDPALAWDPRLDALGVRHVHVEGAQWRVVAAEYWDEARSEGRHHIYLKAQRRDGSPARGIRFAADWVGRLPNQDPGFTTTDDRGEANLPMFINFDPNLKNGIMFAHAADALSDEVRGMGLPFNHHVCFVLTFQEG